MEDKTRPTPSDFFQRYKLYILGGVAVVIIFLCALTLLVIVLSRINSQNVGTNKVITDEDLKTITQGIAFSDSRTTQYVYQSPVENFQITVNTQKYDLSETFQGISILPLDYKDSSVIRISREEPLSSTYVFDLAKEISSYKKFVATYTEGKITKEEDTTLDGNPAHKIVYSRKTFGDTVQKGIAVLSVKDNHLFTMEYSVEAKDDLQGTELDQFLASFKFIDSSKINPTATYTSGVWGYDFKYNTKLWELDNSSNSMISLSPRNISQDSNQRANVQIYSQEVSRFDLLGKETVYLSDAVKQEIGSLQGNTYGYPGFKFIKQEDVDLSGKKAVLLTFELTPKSAYDYKAGQIYMVLHYNTLTKIEIDYNSSTSDTYIDFQNLITSFDIREPSAGVVKGTSSDSTDTEKTVLLTQPAVVRIYNKTCGKLAIPYEATFPLTSGKSYSLCLAETGSGFFINSDGYIGTNGHVTVIADDELVLMSMAYYTTTDSMQLAINLYRDYYEPRLESSDPTYKPLSDKEITTLLVQNDTLRKEIANSIYNVFKAEKKPLVHDQQLYVQRGSAAFLIDHSGDLSNATSHYKATFVDSNFDPLDFNQTGPTSDVAIIKIDKGDYPTLTLGDGSGVINGENIIVIGFPGLASDQSFLSENSAGIATVTKGIVSALKKAPSNLNLIQIDASMNHGNSGGPGVDPDANVVGIASLGANDGQSASDFNYLRDIKDLVELMKKNNIQNTTGQTETQWSQGVNQFFDNHFSAAITSLSQAQKLYPDLIDVDNLITVAKAKIAAGLDVKQDTQNQSDIQNFIGNLSATDKILFLSVGALLCLVLNLTFVVMLFMLRSRGKSRVQSQPVPVPEYQPAAPPAYLTQPEQVEPVTPDPVYAPPPQPQVTYQQPVQEYIPPQQPQVSYQQPMQQFPPPPLPTTPDQQPTPAQGVNPVVPSSTGYSPVQP